MGISKVLLPSFLLWVGLAPPGQQAPLPPSSVSNDSNADGLNSKRPGIRWRSPRDLEAQDPHKTPLEPDETNIATPTLTPTSEGPPANRRTPLPGPSETR